MSKGVQEVLEVAAALVILYVTGGEDWEDAAKLFAMAAATDRARRGEEKAKAAYNASLRDRYVMSRSTTAARRLVFGRCRVSGPVFFVASYGSNREHLAFCVALAAHEVDAIETVYFDGKPISLDGSGNVVGIAETESFTISAATATVTLTGKPKTGSVTAQARYGSTIVPLTVTAVSGSTVSVSGAHSSGTGELDIFYQPDPDPYGPATTASHSETFTIVTGSDTFTTSAIPDVGTVYAATVLTSPTANDSVPVAIAGLSGNHVTITGAAGQIGRQVNIHYQTTTGVSKARVRKYLGTSTQTADAALISHFPGIWTANHKATGVAYLVVELDYDDGTFAGGIPEVSAVVRGMKCYDPRTSTTAWTENPALHARALATSPLAGALPTSAIDDAAVGVAANVCDTSTTYTVGGQDYVRPLYTAGYTFSVDQKPTDGLTDLCEAMGGDWVFADGTLRMCAGSYRTPVMDADESWLIRDASVSIQAATPRAQLVNTVTASFADQFHDFTVVPMPRLSPATYTTADGATLAQDIQYGAVTFAGQAQYLASVYLRRMRNGLVVTLQCNMRAWQAQRFDVIRLTLARFGWNAKPFEVMEDTWSTDGAISLTLREIAAADWDMDAGFPDVDLAPNTDLPLPWGLPVPTSLAAVSGATTLLQQADGTVVSRILVSWDPIADARVLLGGQVEVRYWRAGDSANNYETQMALGSDTQAYLTGVSDGNMYIIEARTVSSVTASTWCPQISHVVAGKTGAPADVAGAAYSEGSGRIHITWTADTDGDYKLTEVREGASWAAGTLIGRASGTSLDWVGPAAGTYDLWLAHQNWSGIYSGTPASLAVTVDAGINGGGYTFALSAPSATLTADASGHVTSYAGVATMAQVLFGATDDTSNWTIGKTDSTGVTSSLSGATVTVTNMADATDSGYVDVTATRTGYATLTARFQLSKSKAGGVGGIVQNWFAGASTGSSASGSGQSADSRVRMNSDGTIDSFSAVAGSGSYTSTGVNWFVPTTAGVGASYWVRATVRSGSDPLTSGTTGSYVLISGAPSWRDFIPAGPVASKETYLDLTIAADASGSPGAVVGTATIYLEVDES